MKYKIEFQYKPNDRERPYDEVQDQPIQFDHGEFVPIPAVGDSVAYMESGDLHEYKVLTRHFAYMNNWCAVTIVVTDISADEMARRLKM